MYCLYPPVVPDWIELNWVELNWIELKRIEIHARRNGQDAIIITKRQTNQLHDQKVQSTK